MGVETPPPLIEMIVFESLSNFIIFDDLLLMPSEKNRAPRMMVQINVGISISTCLSQRSEPLRDACLLAYTPSIPF
jgi:hypothetical protein